MAAWHRRHVALVESPLQLQCSLFGPEPSASDPEDSLIDDWARLIAGGEVDYQSALSHAERELFWSNARASVGEETDLQMEDERS